MTFEKVTTIPHARLDRLAESIDKEEIELGKRWVTSYRIGDLVPKECAGAGSWGIFGTFEVTMKFIPDSEVKEA